MVSATSTPRTAWSPREALSSLALVGGAITAIIVLARLGGTADIAADWPRLWTWLGAQTPETALLGIAHGVALALAIWVAASIVLTSVAYVTKVPVLIRSVEWMALPWVRRLAHRIAALSLTVTTIAPGAAPPAMAGHGEAHGEQAPIVAARVDDDGRQRSDVSVVPPPFLVEPSPLPAPRGDPPLLPADRIESSPVGSSLPPAAAAGGVATGRVSIEHVVVGGEHLWSIAADRLSHVLGRKPIDPETAVYWLRLVEANRGRLHSGDPDLIYPGEVITLPPSA